MGEGNGVGGIGPQQVQQVKIESTSPESASPKVGRLGSHSVKVVSPSASGKANLVQSKDQLAASLGGRESAVDSFLRKTETLRDYINTRLAEQGRSGGSLSLKSDLSAAINSRADAWIDTMSTLMDEGVSAEEIDRMSAETVSELFDLVDRSFAESPKAASAESPKAATAEKTEAASAAPKTVSAEKLVEEEPRHNYSSKASAALAKATQTEVPVGKTHVYKNLGGGSCFFHSILQLLAKSDPSRYPAGHESKAALNLRKSLIGHVHELTEKMVSEETRGMKAVVSKDGDKEVLTVLARTEAREGSEHMRPITEGFDLAHDKGFEDYSAFADVSTAAFMADYLQRPVVVVSEDRNGDVGVQEFKYGLESGRELAGEPLTIYYDKGRQHFMAVSVDA